MLLKALAAAKRRLLNNECALEQHRGELAQIEAEWNSIWMEAGIRPQTSKEMQSWLEIAGKIRQLKSNLEVAGEQRRNASELENWQTSGATALRGLPVSSFADPATVQEVLRVIDQVFSPRKKRPGRSIESTP